MAEGYLRAWYEVFSAGRVWPVGVAYREEEDVNAPRARSSSRTSALGGSPSLFQVIPSLSEQYKPDDNKKAGMDAINPGFKPGIAIE
ncbi:MAG TPA: hypothetical protein PLG75_12210 [Methanoculleus sp.]|nr:hypothetical protein [Methanoculleus sp.]